MSGRELLRQLRERGVELIVDGERLRFRPKSAVSPELFEQIKEHKPRLIKLLEWERRSRVEADRRGLLIRWSKYPTWIRLHDPTTGEWHEVKAAECLPRVIETANRHRKKRGAGMRPEITERRKGDTA